MPCLHSQIHNVSKVLCMVARIHIAAHRRTATLSVPTIMNSPINMMILGKIHAYTFLLTRQPWITYLNYPDFRYIIA